MQSLMHWENVGLTASWSEAYDLLRGEARLLPKCPAPIRASTARRVILGFVSTVPHAALCLQWAVMGGGVHTASDAPHPCAPTCSGHKGVAPPSLLFASRNLLVLRERVM